MTNYLIKFKKDPIYYIATTGQLESIKKRSLACFFPITNNLVSGLPGESIDKYNPQKLDTIPFFAPPEKETLEDFFNG